MTDTLPKCKHTGGCARAAVTAGWCAMHYRRVHEKGDPGPVGALARRARAQSPTCIAEESGTVCGKATVGNSMCSTHQRRLQRNGTLERTRVRAGTPCSHPDGCPRTSKRKGWCAMHHDRVTKTGTAGPIEAVGNGPKGRLCGHPDGCDRPHDANGWCSAHLARVARTGKPGPAKIRPRHGGPKSHTTPTERHHL